MYAIKTCAKCKQLKELDAFYINRAAKSGRQPYCKPCQSSLNDGGKARERHLRRKYGMSQRKYQELYDAQGGRCAICSELVPLLYIDHCHRSGSVRGLLCRDCNSGLGLFRDDPKRLQAAAHYVLVSPATRAQADRAA